MQIKLKKLKIINFKGIQHFETDLHHITNVYGDNATGKTTIFDAFLWLFFGKNSEDASQFEVKRLDQYNNFIKDLESEVEATLHIDGAEIVAKKVLRQKWVKRRGDINSVYSGDENVYFWNDVPLKESEFKTKITGIVVENIFKLITNPFYFNSLKWQERRNILIAIAGNISNAEVFDVIVTASNKHQYTELMNALNANKTLDEFKRELAAKKKKIKDEADYIPSRIDEVRKGMPKDINFEALALELKAFNLKLQKIDTTLNDEVALQQEENTRRANLLKEHNTAVQARQQKMFDIKTKMQNIEFDVKQKAKETSGTLDSQISSLTRNIDTKKLDRDRYQKTVNDFNAEVDEKENALDKLREDYNVADDETLPPFDDNAFKCPSCKQSLPADDIESLKETLTSNFNTNKLKNLQKIQSDAAKVKAELEKLNDRIKNGNIVLTELNAEIKKLNTELDVLKTEAAAPKQSVEEITAQLLTDHEEYMQLKQDLFNTESIVLTAPEFTPMHTNDDLKTERITISNKIAEINRELAKEEQITKANERIKELTEQESALAQELAKMEGSEFAIMEFTKAKVDVIERRINGRFKNVRFKMFDKQVNGGEVETCETLVNSNGSFVPFTDANNAARINSGIDIINTLCQHYDVYAPIFIDNRESVTRLIDSESQIVNLIVSEVDKQLRVA